MMDAPKKETAFDVLVKGLGLQCWTYLIRTRITGFLIDPGPDYAHDDVVNGLDKLGLSPESIKYALITHAHVDHCLGADCWQEYGTRLVGSPQCADFMEKADRSIWTEHPERIKPVHVDIIAEDNEILQVGELEIRCISTPGHTKDSMSYSAVIADKRYLFTGDILMPDGNPGWSGGPDFSVGKTLSSLKTILDLEPDVICTGHGIVSENVRQWLEDAVTKGRHQQWHLKR